MVWYILLQGVARRPRPTFPSKYHHHQAPALHWITEVTRRRGWERGHEPRSRPLFFPSIPVGLGQLGAGTGAGARETLQRNGVTDPGMDGMVSTIQP